MAEGKKPRSKRPSFPSPRVPEGLMRVNVELGSHIFDLDLAEQAEIPLDFKGLNESLSRFPGDLGTWSMMEQIARKILDELEAKLEIKEAELQGEVRARLARADIKATVKEVEAHVTLDKGRMELAEMILKAKHDLGLIVAGRQTIYTKKDCMLALGSNYRAEMDTGLSVKDRVGRAKEQLEDLYKGGK